MLGDFQPQSSLSCKNRSRAASISLSLTGRSAGSSGGISSAAEGGATERLFGP
jgi:hypothetical protein